MHDGAKRSETICKVKIISLEMKGTGGGKKKGKTERTKYNDANENERKNQTNKSKISIYNVRKYKKELLFIRSLVHLILLSLPKFFNEMKRDMSLRCCLRKS